MDLAFGNRYLEQTLRESEPWIGLNLEGGGSRTFPQFEPCASESQFCAAQVFF